MENIIMFVADQWRSDSLKVNGNDACDTPILDSLIDDGVNFSNAFCQNPVCVPSRCSFLSGLYPHTSGHRTMHFLMDEEEQNLLRTLKDNGYDVFWGGRNDFLRKEVDPLNYANKRTDPSLAMFKAIKGGKLPPEEMAEYEKLKKKEKEIRSKKGYKYSHFRGVGETGLLGDVDKNIIDEAITYLDEYDRSKPLFMYLTGILPHPPYGVEEEFFNKIDMSKVKEPIRLTPSELEKKPSILRGIRKNQGVHELSDEQLREIKAVYYAMGSKLDYHIGRLIKELKERGLYDSTTFIFFADHGDYTGDYEMVEKSQNTFEDMLTNVPLIIKPSKGVEVKPRSTDALVELIDVQATILDIAGISPDYTHFGRSLIDCLRGDDLHREVVFCEGGRLKCEGTFAMDAGHKEGNEYWPRTIEQTKMPEHTKAIMTRGKRFKYVYRLYEEDEFYDLEKDPMERNNLIGEIYANPVLMKNYVKLKDHLLDHMVSTGDVVPQRRDERM